MPTYRHRPTTVEAEPYRPGLEDGLLDGQPYIATSEGPMMIGLGDMIVTGVKGERYPVKPDVFDLVYEAVSDKGNIQWPIITQQQLDELKRYTEAAHVTYLSAPHWTDDEERAWLAYKQLKAQRDAAREIIRLQEIQVAIARGQQ